jgi:hypothetical protein
MTVMSFPRTSPVSQRGCAGFSVVSALILGQDQQVGEVDRAVTVEISTERRLRGATIFISSSG